MNRIHLDVWIGIGMLLLAGYFYSVAQTMPDDPALFPKLLLIILMIFSGLIFAQGAAATLKAHREQRAAPQFFPALRGPMAVFACLVGYVALIDFLGFFASTSLAAVAFMWLFGLRRPARIALVVLGIDVFIYLLFVWQLQIALPGGLLI